MYKKRENLSVTEVLSKKVAMTYSPTNGTKWSSLVPTAIGRTQHGRSSCPCGLRIDGTIRREERALTVLYNKKRTSF